MDRFWSKVDINPHHCWEWQASLFQTGYGAFSRNGMEYAHRVSYELTNGAIPESLQIDHLCRNRKCVNPDHLEAVTSQENMRRAKAIITHCPQNHSEWRIKRNGHRDCAACHRIRERARRRK